MNRNYYFLGGILSIIALSFAGGFGIVSKSIADENEHSEEVMLVRKPCCDGDAQHQCNQVPA